MAKRSKCSAYIEEAVGRFNDELMDKLDRMIEENARLDAKIAEYQEIARRKKLQKNNLSNKDE